jgi:S-adenosylmethionine hydrolase
VSSGKLAILRAGVLALVLTGCAARRPAAVVFLSDFGTADDSVAICKGVMLGIEPQLRIVDLTHEVPPFSVRDGARLLAGTAPYYPPGTVFVAVVDPGVGGPRKAIVVASRRGQYFVVPDNGLVTFVADRDGVREAREITNPSWIARDGSSTFHGRDVFAPVTARLARGDDWTAVGPPLANLVRLEASVAQTERTGIVAQVIGVDGPYGNLITNVQADDFGQLGWTLGDRVPVKLEGRSLLVPFVRTFGDVPVGKPLLYVDSRGRLAFAINQGNFARSYRVVPPASLAIARKSR